MIEGYKVLQLLTVESAAPPPQSPPVPQNNQMFQTTSEASSEGSSLLLQPPGSSTHIVQHGGPPFHGDALEDGQHSKKDVIKLGDPIVGANPVPAFVTSGAALHTTRVRGVESFQNTCRHIWRAGDIPHGG